MSELLPGDFERRDMRRRDQNRVERIEVARLEPINETLLSADGSAGPGAGVIDVFPIGPGRIVWIGFDEKSRLPLRVMLEAALACMSPEMLIAARLFCALRAAVRR